MRRSVPAALVAAFLLLLGLFASPLAAQSTATDGSDFEVLRVESSGDSGLVTFRPQADPPADAQLQIDLGGETVDASVQPLSRSSVDQFTILIVDNSENADTITGFSQVRESALAYLNTVSANTRVMLVAAGGGSTEIRPEVTFTNNHESVRSAINGLRPSGASLIWNAVADSTQLFAQDGNGIRNVVVFAGSPGEGSTVTPAIAQGNLLTADAGLTVIAPDVANLDVASLTQVSQAVRGGIFLRGTADDNMVAVAGQAGRIHQSTLVGSFSGAPADSITVQYGGASERVRAVAGGIAAGAGLEPAPIAETSRFDVLRTGGGPLVAIGLAVVAALLFSFSMFQIFAGDDNTLTSTLSHYGPQDDPAAAAADAEFASQRAKIIEQVVERAEEAAAARGNLGSTTTLLEKAEIPLRVGEAFALQLGLVVVALVLGFFVTGGVFGGLIFAVIAAVGPVMFVKFKVKQRAKKLEDQLPDTLTLLASTLKAGYSFIQGMDAVANEGEEPLAGEFRRTVNEARLGKDLDVALDDLSERVASVDLLWAIVAIKIQREVGGNLAELLTTVADTMTQRTRLRGEVAALTAEGRVSALVLLVLPFGVGAAMYFMNQAYISTLWSHTLGFVALGVAGVSMVIGALWMRKIVDIEI